MRILFLGLGVAASLYLSVIAGLYVFQDHLIFAAGMSNQLSEKTSLADFDEVSFVASDGITLSGLYAKARPGRPSFLFFHGKGGTVFSRKPLLLQLRNYGFGVLAFEYRGFGKNKGIASEKLFVQDNVLGYDFLLRQGVDASQIILLGESLGTNVAVDLAAKREVGALILLSSMSSLKDIAQHRYPFVPVASLIKHPFRSDLKIGRVKAPFLALHGTNDQRVPLKFARDLFKKAPEPKEFYEVVGAGHNNLYEFPVVEEMVRFIKVHKIAYFN